MLRLTWEQLDRLEQLTLKRHAASISGVLAETWPALTERLGDRWPAFVEAAVQQGRKHGLRDARDLARYASLWCIWGPAFDGKPSFAWAAEILADPRRGAALKLHQLAHRTRQELQQRQAAEGGGGGRCGAGADHRAVRSALAGVDARIGRLAAARSVFPSSDPAPLAVKACDVGVIDMMVAEAENLQEYRHTPQRLAAVRGRQARRRCRQVDARARGAGRARRDEPRLARRRAGAAQPAHRAACRLRSARPSRGRPRRRRRAPGMEGARHGAPQPGALCAAARRRSRPAPPLPGIAAEAPFDLQTVQHRELRPARRRCAVRRRRDGAARLRRRAMADRSAHPAWEPMVWPAPAEAGPAPTATCKLEKDGAPADAAAWQQSWRGLHGAFRAGMERLYNEWTRALDSDGVAARGRGLAAGRPGRPHLGLAAHVASSVAMRTEGALDLLALSIDLRLSGELVGRLGALADPRSLQGAQRAAHDDRPARATRRRKART